MTAPALDEEAVARVAAATVLALQQAGHLPPPSGGLAPSPPAPLPSGPPRWRFGAAVDWSDGVGPTPRTELWPFAVDGLVGDVTVEVYAEPPDADGQPDPEGTPALYARYLGVVEADDQAAVEQGIAAAITTVAQQSTPATEGWAVAYSVRPA